MPFAIGGSIVDINLQRSSASGPGSYARGMSVRTSNGGECIYLKSNSNGSTKGRFVGITVDSTAVPVIDSNLVEGRRIAVAINSVPPSTFAFYAVAGVWPVFTGSSGFDADQPLFACSQAGTLSTTTSTADYVVGIQLAAVAASSTATIALNYPRCQRYGGGA